MIGYHIQFVTPSNALFYSSSFRPFPAVRGNISIGSQSVSLRAYWPVAPFLFLMSLAGRLCLLPVSLHLPLGSEIACLVAWGMLAVLLAIYYAKQRATMRQKADIILAAIVRQNEDRVDKFRYM